MSTEVGDRVRLICCTDEYTRLAPGELGTVLYIDDAGTVFVDWDSGARLGLVAEAGDRFENLGPCGGCAARCRCGSGCYHREEEG